MADNYDEAIKFKVKVDTSELEKTENEIKKTVDNSIKEIDRLNKTKIEMPTIDTGKQKFTERYREVVNDTASDIQDVVEEITNAIGKPIDANGMKLVSSKTMQDAKGNVKTTQTWKEELEDIEKTYTVINGIIKSIAEKPIKESKRLKPQANVQYGHATDMVDEEAYQEPEFITKLKEALAPVKEIKDSFEKMVAPVKKVVNGIKGVGNESKKASKHSSKLAHLFKNISKIVLYRLIRKAMADIAKSIKEATQNLAKFDSTYNATISKIVTASAKIKNGLAIMFRPLIETLAPIFEAIGNSFTKITNEISRQNALAKGQATYTKINAKYAKDYADSLDKSNKLLGFDKFNTLAKGDDNTDIFGTEQVQAETTEELNDTETGLISVIGGLINTIDELLDDINEILGPALSLIVDVLEPIMPIITSILQPVMKLIRQLIPPITRIVNVLVAIITPILELIEPVLEIIGNVLIWVLNLLTPIITLLKPLGGLLKSLIEPLLIPLKLISQFLAFISNLLSPIYNALVDISNSFLGKITGLSGLFSMPAQALGDLASTGIDRANQYVLDSDYGNFISGTTDKITSAIENSTSNIHIDFSGWDNNAISRELAKSMAEQMRKQNITVTGVE